MTINDPNEGFAPDLSQFYGTSAQVIPALLLILTIETNVLRWIFTAGARLFSDAVVRSGSPAPQMALPQAFLFIVGPVAIVVSVAAEALAFFQLAAEPADQVDAGFAVPAIGTAIFLLLVGVVIGLMRTLFAGFRLGVGGRELVLPPEQQGDGV